MQNRFLLTLLLCLVSCYAQDSQLLYTAYSGETEAHYAPADQAYTIHWQARYAEFTTASNSTDQTLGTIPHAAAPRFLRKALTIKHANSLPQITIQIHNTGDSPLSLHSLHLDYYRIWSGCMNEVRIIHTSVQNTVTESAPLHTQSKFTCRLSDYPDLDYSFTTPIMIPAGAEHTIKLLFTGRDNQPITIDNFVLQGAILDKL